MKIVFFIPSLGSGGAERVVSVLASEFAQRGHDVHIAMLANRNLYYPLIESVSIHYLDCEKDLGLPVIKRYLKRLSKIRHLTRTISPDVVISFMAETNIDVCLALVGIRMPIIVSERNDPAIDPASRAKQWLRRLAYLKPAHFVFQTPDAQAYFSRRIQKRSSIILNPLSSNLPKHFIGEREPRIVSVGRLHSQKNITLLLTAFAEVVKKYPQYSLEIYGEGPLEERIKEKIHEMNLQEKVLLKGFCKDVHQKIVAASMFVMTSDYEGMPNALLEAMAIGLPCISTDCPCGGPRMLIQSGINGQLVPVADEKLLIQAMEYYADHPDKAKQMGMLASDVAKLASSDSVLAQWEICIKRIVS